MTATLDAPTAVRPTHRLVTADDYAIVPFSIANPSAVIGRVWSPEPVVRAIGSLYLPTCGADLARALDAATGACSAWTYLPGHSPSTLALVLRPGVLPEGFESDDGRGGTDYYHPTCAYCESEGWDLYANGRCESCAETCYDCGYPFDGTRETWYSDRYCTDCVRICAHCDAEYVGDYSDHCDECSPGLSPYGTTEVELFHGCECSPYGGRGEGCDGLHVGIELETGALGSGTIEAARDFARRHLSGYLDAKEDCTVEAEFVTQPMTPDFFNSVPWEQWLNGVYWYGTGDRSDVGLHVHVSRDYIEPNGFGSDLLALAAFVRLIEDEECWEIAGRRGGYNSEIGPVAELVKRIKQGRTPSRAHSVNLNLNKSLEVRLFNTADSADELRARVRYVIDAARYVRHLRDERKSIAHHATAPKMREWIAREGR